MISGKKLWAIDTTGLRGIKIQSAKSMLVSMSAKMSGGEGMVVEGIDAKTGARTWKWTPPNQELDVELKCEGDRVIVKNDTILCSLDPSTGKELWRAKFKGRFGTYGPLAKYGMVQLWGGRKIDGGKMAPAFYAFEQKTGKPLIYIEGSPGQSSNGLNPVRMGQKLVCWNKPTIEVYILRDNGK